ncbi:hypothetical protein ABB37_00823 [Leptomonas pyrrhocoris]|uniref:Uncharacterized protein n=1 Tax=Leptomonas pyrrhocoris TaxID=157538 RepID=A0A0M9GB87_LEPPY|nr:hypothetical protein ABB37_00823 [Leptomonas pyrrhocoris]KPA86743.1 hypothetical protein ABB37_00823 [Leptomonas pyrrhocoris]|eukprot:XP_015665182.1 hypothetical protein ABB37_00823 [Leptomonas pyrrhocoris]
MSVKNARSSKELVEAARTHLADSNFSPTKAGDLLTRAIQQDPTFVNALVLRSNLASRLGQISAAVADLSLAIEVDRGSSDGRRVASLYGSRSSLLVRAGRPADAIADLHAALKSEPDNGMWAYELGRVYLKEGHVSLAQLNFQRALQESMWSHVNESTRPKVYALYGRSCLMSHDYKKAKGLLRKSLDLGGEGAAVLHDVGLAHYHEGTSPTSAIDFFVRAMEMDSQAVVYPMHLGLAHTRCGNFNDALSSMNEAVLRGQEEALLRFYRGCIELQLGLGPQALVDLQAAAELQGASESEGSVATSAKKRDNTFRTAVTSSAPAWIAIALVHLFCGHALDMAATSLATALQKNVDRQQRILAGVLLGIVRHQQDEALGAVRAFSDVVSTMQQASKDAKDSNENVLTSSTFDCRFSSDMELLTLTHVGLAYGACGYADLALRFFTQARQRAQQRGDAVQVASCLFREAVAQVELKDNWGALENVQLCTAAAGGASADGKGSPSPVPTDSDISSAALPSLRAAAAAAAAVTSMTKAHRKSRTSSLQTSTERLSAEHASPCPSLLTVHRLAPGETAHLYAVTLRRLGRLSEALPFATAAVEAVLLGTASSATRAGGRNTRVGAAGVPAYLYHRAFIHFSLRNYAEAMSDVQACIKACGTPADTAGAATTSADPYYLRGCVAHAMGDFADALASLTSALEVDTTLRESPVFSYSHGVLLAIAGKHEAAIVAFTAAILHSGGTKEAPRCPAVYHHERAKVFQQMGRYAEALADYNCVLPTKCVVSAKDCDLQLSNVNWNALVNRALTLKELQRYEEAATDWDAALRLDRSGCLEDLTTQDVFEMPYMDLCLPGCELHDVESDVI